MTTTSNRMETKWLLTGVAIAIGAWVVKLARDITRIGQQTRTAWDFQMLRADEELRQKGLLKRGVEELSPAARSAFGVILPELKAFYLENGVKLSDHDLLLAIEKNFGKRLVDDICPMLGIYMGGCVTIALRLMKE